MYIYINTFNPIVLVHSDICTHAYERMNELKGHTGPPTAHVIHPSPSHLPF